MTIQNQTRSHRAQSLENRHRALIRAAHARGFLPLDRVVVAYLPGDRLPHFVNKRFRPMGLPIQVTLLYLARHQDGQDWYLLEGRKRQEVRGGWIEYEDNPLAFHFNGLLNPQEQARAMRMDVGRHRALLEMLLAMHSACQASVKYVWQPQQNLIRPTVWCGYQADRRPGYQDSPELREKAAQELGIAEHRLGLHGGSVLQEYLRHLWDELWIQPDHPDNDTGLALIEARYCSLWHVPVQRFEDFAHLTGLRLSNPWWVRQDYDPNNADHCTKLKQLIPEFWSEAVTEADWQAATARPSQPLFASGASRLQIVQASALEQPTHAAA